VFGWGLDLCIEDKNSKNKSYSNLGDSLRTYEWPPGCKSKEEANEYLAGSNEFTIKEIEVFRINFK
jgi:hypothetical protein